MTSTSGPDTSSEANHVIVGNITTKGKKKRSFVGDVLTIAGGTTFAQALSIMLTPIMTRLYGPEAYGIAAVFLSITNVLGVIICLRYELTIMLPEKEEEAANLLALSLLSTTLISILTLPIVLIGNSFIIHLLKAPEMGKYIVLISPTIFASGVFLAFNYWLSRSRHFGSISLSRVVGSNLATASQLIAGLLGHTTGGSIIGAGIFGTFASTAILLIKVRRDHFAKIIRSINWKSILTGIVRYRKFPILDTWSALINSISWQMQIFFLSSYFSSAVVGYYSLGCKVLFLPSILVGSAVSQVFLQRTAEAKMKGTLSSVVESTFLHLVIFGIFPFLLLALIGKEAFIVVFGKRWTEAGIYVQILAMWMFIAFVATPISNLFIVHEKQKQFFIYNIILFLSRAASLFIGAQTGNIFFALALFAIVDTVTNGAQCLWLFNISRISLFDIMKKLGKYPLWCAVAIGIIGLAKWVFILNSHLILLIGCLAFILYYGYIIQSDAMIQSYLRHLFFPDPVKTKSEI